MKPLRSEVFVTNLISINVFCSKKSNKENDSKFCDKSRNCPMIYRAIKIGKKIL